MWCLGRWKMVVFRAIRWGKVTTALQFIVLSGLVLEIDFPGLLFAAFVGLGWLAFLELFQTAQKATIA
jgi:CDP-diacylglycerol--glycerol-3-phosphate 3-phosphatidyltransferase